MCSDLGLNKYSGLHYACGLGDVDAVRALISCGAEVDAQVIWFSFII